MATVSKGIADRVIAGGFPEDNIVKIVEYTNAFGGVSYGLVTSRDDPDRYQASMFVHNPRIYWEKPQ